MVSETWDHKTLLTWFLQSYWENCPAKNYAAGLLMFSMKENRQAIQKQAFLSSRVQAVKTMQLY